MSTSLLLLLALTQVVTLAMFGCAPDEPNDLDKLGTIELTINDQKFKIWVADDNDERERGLMFVTSEQMAPLPDGTERGMLFVFPRERHLSFWMHNTFIPLDIAYMTTEGRVTATHTMAPLDTDLGKYQSEERAQYALEVRAGVLADVNVAKDDTIEIPDSVLKDVR